MKLMSIYMFRETSVLFLVLAVVISCSGKSTDISLNAAEKVKMDIGHLLWIEESRQYPGENEYYFALNPVMGLLDIDSHRITDDGWKYLSAQNSETTANLWVPPFVTMKELQAAIDTLRTKGRFKRVKISIGNP